MIKGMKTFLFASVFLASPTAVGPAYAQGILGSSLFGSNSGAQKDQDERLAVEAGELVYDKDRSLISAYDKVELSYQGQTLQADRVTYDQKNGRVFAAGHVRMIDNTGAITTAERFELTGGFKDGFIDSLRTEKPVEGGLKARLSSPRAERVNGETTILDRGTYTACDSCKKNPEKPPLWQIKASRVIHDGKEKTIYYEDARLEIWGVPVAYTPYFWTPDPTVSRKTGFLTPGYSNSSGRGTSVQVPFFWALGPNYDLTLSPAWMSRQGFFGQAEWRHRLETGLYSIRVSGISQRDPDAFAKGRYGAGDKKKRGSIETEGEFFINQNWKWGWNASVMTDKWFFENYGITGKGYSNIFYQEAISTLYLNGMGDRSYFDMRGYHFKVLSTYDWQQQQPVVHPVLDYNKRFNGPEALGGEVNLDFNFTSLSRTAAQYRQIPVQQERLFDLYDTCAVFDKSDCLLRGIAGTTSRASLSSSWQKEFIDPVGQVWKPFVFARGDMAWVSQNHTGYQNAYQNSVSQEIDDYATRFLVGAGVEYRYPLVARFGSWGTQLLEPIAQLIVRTNEQRIGKLPNEDAQNMVFDDTNLFEWNKFSGYDRVEGGTRANVGAKYTVQSDAGARMSILAGQSFHLAGENSFVARDLVNTGLDSGLENRRSDYIGRIQVIPNRNFSLFARGRFDSDTFSAKRVEVGATFAPSSVPVIGSVSYIKYEAQPELGIGNLREGITSTARWKINKNWHINGSVLVDLNYLPETISTNGSSVYKRMWKDEKITARSLSMGFGYDDECLAFNLNYTSVPKEVSQSNGKNERDQIIAFTLEFKTLGPIAFSQNLSDN